MTMSQGAYAVDRTAVEHLKGKFKILVTTSFMLIPHALTVQRRWTSMKQLFDNHIGV